MQLGGASRWRASLRFLRDRRYGRAAVVFAAGLVIALLGWMPAAVAPAILTVRDRLMPADAIVVLGGDARTRPPLAARLFREGWAPRVLISGAGDCRMVEFRLLRLQVPRDRLMIECGSRTTRENALFAGEMLRREGLRHIILVTSWQHSARASATFVKLDPALSVTSYPTRPQSGWLVAGSLSAALGVYEEYVKLAGYCLTYGICP